MEDYGEAEQHFLNPQQPVFIPRQPSLIPVLRSGMYKFINRKAHVRESDAWRKFGRFA
jgi:hypothetical protein